jgi:hypothetical protein
MHFKQWLYQTLTEKYYYKLDPRSGRGGVNSGSEGGQMRKVIKQFDALKKKFSSKTVEHSMKIDLPGDLSDITIPNRVDRGEMLITK